MNCKPGDLAIITWTGAPRALNLSGKIIKVTSSRPHYTKPGVVAWEYEGPLLKDLDNYTITGIPDKYLRPVSGLPLHDEVDEEISNKV